MRKHECLHESRDYHETKERHKGKQLDRRNPRAALAQRAIDVKLSNFSPNGNRHQMEQILLNALAEFGIDLSSFF